MKKLIPKGLVLVVLCCGVLVASGCFYSSQKIELNRAEKELKSKNYVKSLAHLQRVIKRDPESDLALSAARQGARISLFQTKEFETSINYYQHLIIYSKDDKERRNAQWSIANIYFEKLNNYEQAIKEFNKLLALKVSDNDKVEIRFVLAKSYFYLNQFFQAETEITSLLGMELEKRWRYQLLVFKGNVVQAKKDLKAAIKVYQQALAEFPELSKQDKVALTIAVCYEELSEIDKAIEILKFVRTYYEEPDFIDLKIKRLAKRKENLPGAKGLRK